jgi:hypothetical protein
VTPRSETWSDVARNFKRLRLEVRASRGAGCRAAIAAARSTTLDNARQRSRLTTLVHSTLLHRTRRRAEAEHPTFVQRRMPRATLRWNMEGKDGSIDSKLRGVLANAKLAGARRAVSGPSVPGEVPGVWRGRLHVRQGQRETSFYSGHTQEAATHEAGGKAVRQ